MAKKKTKGTEIITAMMVAVQTQIDKDTAEIDELESRLATVNNHKIIQTQTLADLDKDLKKLEK